MFIYMAALALCYLGVHWGYLAVMHLKLHRESLTFYWKVIAWPLVAISFVLDVAFNAIFGSLMFWELPRQLLFTSRCKRHFRGSDGWRKRLAQWWAKNLNQFDANHID